MLTKAEFIMMKKRKNEKKSAMLLQYTLLLQSSVSHDPYDPSLTASGDKPLPSSRSLSESAW